MPKNFEGSRDVYFLGHFPEIDFHNVTTERQGGGKDFSCCLENLNIFLSSLTRTIRHKAGGGFLLHCIYKEIFSHRYREQIEMSEFRTHLANFLYFSNLTITQKNKETGVLGVNSLR